MRLRSTSAKVSRRWRLLRRCSNRQKKTQTKKSLNSKHGNYFWASAKSVPLNKENKKILKEFTLLQMSTVVCSTHCITLKLMIDAQTKSVWACYANGHVKLFKQYPTTYELVSNGHQGYLSTQVLFTALGILTCVSLHPQEREATWNSYVSCWVLLELPQQACSHGSTKTFADRVWYW